MSETGRCKPHTLAQEGPMRVDLCGCGQVHVTMGPFTVRLDRAHYLRLCDALVAAVQKLPEEERLQLH